MQVVNIMTFSSCEGVQIDFYPLKIIDKESR